MRPCKNHWWLALAIRLLRANAHLLKKQGAVSGSTTSAETAAMSWMKKDWQARSCSRPRWSHRSNALSARTTATGYREKIVTTGYSKRHRHIKMTRAVSFASMAEQLSQQKRELQFTNLWEHSSKKRTCSPRLLPARQLIESHL